MDCFVAIAPRNDGEWLFENRISKLIVVPDKRAKRARSRTQGHVVGFAVAPSELKRLAPVVMGAGARAQLRTEAGTTPMM